MKISLIYQDEFLAIAYKPHGLLMHLSFMAIDEKLNFKDLLEDQLGKPVFLIHRLDRKTAGLVLIAFDHDTAGKLSKLFEERKINKTYWAICRGHLLENAENERSLENENGNLQTAHTYFKPLAHTTIPLKSDRYEVTRLTLIECKPITGRRHQIRRHLAQLRHYIVNDKPHGDCKLNKAFETQWELKNMMLLARKLEFQHPITSKLVSVICEPEQDFSLLLDYFNYKIEK